MPTYTVPLVSGGISRQAPEVRARGQVSVATNVDFSLVDGASLRSGTRHVATVSLGADVSVDTAPAVDALGGSVRVLACSDGLVRVLNADGSSPSVWHRGAAAAYLLAGQPARLSVVQTVSGDVVIANASVATALRPTGQVKIAGTVPTTDDLFSLTPAPLSVWRSNASGVSGPAGLYRYNPQDAQFASVTFSPWTTGTSSSGRLANLIAPTANPRGMTLWVATVLFPAAPTATATHGTGYSELTFPFVLPGRRMVAGESVFLSSPSALAPVIQSVREVGGNTVVRTNAIAGSPGTITATGSGVAVTLAINFSENPPASMEEAARTVERALVAGGVPDATCSWVWTNYGTYQGRFVISSGLGGQFQGFPAACAFAPPAATPTTLDDTVTSSTRMFNSPAVTAGRGAQRGLRLAAARRWTAVPAPNQDDSVVDAATMPVRLRALPCRTPGPSGYEDLMKALGPGHYFPLQTTVEECGDVTGRSLLLRDGGTLLSMLAGPAGGTSTRNRMTSAANIFEPFALNKTVGSAHTLSIFHAATAAANPTLMQVGTGAGNAITLALSGTTVVVTAFGFTYTTASVTGLQDATWKHVAAVVEVGAGGTTVTVYVNSTPYGTTQSGTGPFAAGDERSVIQINPGSGAQTSVAHAAYWPEAVPQHVFATLMQAMNGPSATQVWTVEPAPWKARLSGNAASNPAPTPLSDKRQITSLASWQARLHMGLKGWWMASATNDPYQLFANDAALIVDSDPIARQVGQDADRPVEFMAPFRGVMVLGTNERQYEVGFGSSSGLSASNSQIQQSTAYALSGYRVGQQGDRLYFVVKETGSLNLLEYTADDQLIPGTGELLAQHAQGLITVSDPIVVASGAGLVAVLDRGSGTGFTFRTAFVGSERRMNAWSTLALTGATVLASWTEGEDLLLLVRRSGQALLERLSVSYEQPGSFLWQPRMDGRMSLVGSHSAGTTTWTLPSSVPATGLTHAVNAAGSVVSVTPGSGVVTASGNFSGTYQIGRAYSATLTFSRIFLRDQQELARTSLRIFYRHITLRLSRTFGGLFEYVTDSRAAKQRNLPTVSTIGKLQGPVSGRADTTTLSVKSTTPQPWSVGGCDIDVDAIPERIA
jgi:hypothetical protein